MKKTIGILLLVPFLLWGGIRIYKNVAFGIDCGGRLKRAADANTVEMAKQEMKAAIVYIEKEGMTNGYTSVLYNTPDEDVGFWYQNLKSSLGELEIVKPETTQLERSNLLMKLRETLLDKKQSGESVTIPKGISVFPRNGVFTVWGILGFVALCGGVILIMIGIDDVKHGRHYPYR